MQSYFSDEDLEENPKTKNPKIPMTNSTNQVFAANILYSHPVNINKLVCNFLNPLNFYFCFKLTNLVCKQPVNLKFAFFVC